MIFVYHGDDTFASRQRFFDVLKDYPEVSSLPSKKLSPELIATYTGSLFAQEHRALVLENLFSSTNTQDSKEIVRQIKKLESEIDIFVWEGKKLDQSKITQLGKNCKAIAFKLPSSLFHFLDSIGQNKTETLSFLDRSLKTNPAEMLLALCQGRCRELLLAKSKPTLLKGAPWQKVKLASQVKTLEIDWIASLYLKLIDIDWKNKTGRLGDSLSNQLIALFAEL
ncbi:MAG: hypothetical protein ABID04_00200 [Patescibacteria group bacterium]